MKKSLGYFLFIVVLFSCHSNKKEDIQVERDSYVNEWDFSLQGNGKVSNHNSLLLGGKLRESSLLLNDSVQMLVYQSEHLNKGDQIQVSSHLMGQSDSLVVAVSYFDQQKVHTQVNNFSLAKIDEWRLESFKIKIPWELSNLRISAAVLVGGFELKDLNITTIYNHSEGYLPILRLELPDSSFAQLNEFKSTALENGVISDKEKKYVKGFINDAGVHEPVQVRLKGDWTDHLKTEKDSYRIKMKKSNAFNGWRSFSIQNPSTRRYLNEWVIHEIAKMECLLTTDFNFVSVEINNEKKGVYAIEEHFDKQLVESSDYREGPILKIDESGTWESALYNQNHDSNFAFPYFEAAHISVFKKNRTKKSESLFSQFQNGSKLLRLYLDGYLELNQLFDMDKLAKFYVLAELSGYDHTTRWHNRRFYFNPVTQKLEHIVYDVLPFAKEGADFYMKSKLLRAGTVPEFAFDNALFLDPEFKERFLYHLQLRANKSYLDSIFSILDPKLTFLEKCIQTDEPGYTFEKHKFYDHVEFLQDSLVGLEELWDSKSAKYNAPKDWLRPMNYKENQDTIFFKSISINAYSEVIDSNRFKVYLENYHLNTVKLAAIQLDSGQNYEVPLYNLDELQAFKKDADTLTFYCEDKPKRLFFELANHPGKLYSKKILPWQKQSGKIARMKLDASSYRGLDKMVLEGEQIIDELIYLPKGTQLEIVKGTKLIFQNGGGIICNEGISAIGTQEQPIELMCKDSSSNGLTIFGGVTHIEHCTISGLSNLNYQNWVQTGAVTIYESQVSLVEVNIFNSHAEDALNIIRSEFNISDLHIDTTYSDGFDADFCTGLIANSTINNTGNDGLDFSGSVISVLSVDLNNIGDKGISGGEKSNLFVSNVSVSDCLNGIAAKDESMVFCVNLSIKNAQCHLMAFQKKPEFAPAILAVQGFNNLDNGFQKLIGMGSEIIIDDKYHLGQQFIDIEVLYSQFNK